MADVTATEIMSKVDMKAHAKRMADVLTPRYIDLFELAWEAQAETLTGLGSFNLTNPNAQKALKALAGKRIKDMAATTKDNLRSVLEKALAGTVNPATGLLQTPSIPEIARQIRAEGITNSRDRSVLIARTETATGYSAGSVLGYKEAGVKRKKWLATEDETICPICEELADEVVDIDDNFSDGSPHPPAHPACRCAILPVVERD